MIRRRIYCAGGPYTQGDPETNTYQAIKQGNKLLTLGYAPYIPHLNHYWHREFPHPYETWMALDLEYLAVCDGVYRIKGDSAGADREVAFAVAHNIPVFYSLDVLKAYQW